MTKYLDTIFVQITSVALKRARGHVDLALAYTQAASSVECSQRTRDKGCPRAAFESLSRNGRLTGVSATPDAPPLTKNALYVLTAARLVRAKPELADSKSKLWEAVRLEHGVERRNHNGVLDVFFALWNADALKG